MKYLILLVMSIGYFISGSGSTLGATAQTDVEKKYQDGLRAVRAEKLANFLQSHPGITTSIDEVTGAPQQLFGDLSKGISQTNPVEIAYEFLEQNKELYGMTSPRTELRVEGQKDFSPKMGGGTAVFLEQVYKGVKVSRGYFSVNINSSGKLDAVAGVYSPGIDINPTPSIDSTSAIEIVKRDFKFTPKDEKLVREFLESLRRKNTSPIYVFLTIMPFEDTYHLCWAVTIGRVQPNESYQYFVDAHTGAILQKVLPTGPPNDESKLMDHSKPINQPPIPFVRPSRDSTMKPQGTPKKQSEEGIILISPESYKQIPAYHMDSIRPPYKDLRDSATKPATSLKSVDAKTIEELTKNSPGTIKTEAVEVHLERPIDSIIMDLKKHQSSKKAGKNEKIIKDSSHTNLNEAPATFVNIMTEGFEGVFPEDSPNWYPFDNDTPPNLNGEYYWNDDNFLSFTGSWSGWCAGGGNDGVPGSSNYANNMKSWMVYGPFSLNDATDAEVDFWLWLKTELGPDISSVGASINGTTFYFHGLSGNSSTVPGNVNGWLNLRLPLDSVPIAGDGYLNLIGQSTCWIAFRFISNASITDKGAFVDDIVLKKDVSAGGTPNLYANYTPAGWDGPIEVSCCPGTNKQSQPHVSQPAYIDWAVKNNGSRATSTRTISTLLVDGVEVHRWGIDPPLNPGFVVTVEDTTYVFPAQSSHTVTIIHDSLGSEAEQSEADNRYDYTFNLVYQGENVGQGFGVLGDLKDSIETQCDGGSFYLADLSRMLNNNIHGHNGRMQDIIDTRRWRRNAASVSVTDADNVWSDPDLAPAVDAQVYTGWSYDYLNQMQNRNGHDSVGGEMQCVVEDSTFTNNIGYNRTYNYLDIGASSGGANLSYAGALDVIAHEWGHGVVAFSSRLGLAGEPGALDESFGDMLGATVGFSRNDPDWSIGENANLFLVPLRNMADPYTLGDPDTYRYTSRGWFQTTGCTPPNDDNCGVHTNCGVPNKMFYLFAVGGTHPVTNITVHGIGIDSAMKVMLRANEGHLWNTTTNFLQARNGSIAAASQFSSAWADTLKKAWDAVGVCKKLDLNEDGSLTSADAVAELNCVFLGQNCNACVCDLNCKDGITSTDAVIALNVIYLGSQKGKPDGCPDP